MDIASVQDKRRLDTQRIFGRALLYHSLVAGADFPLTGTFRFGVRRRDEQGYFISAIEVHLPVADLPYKPVRNDRIVYDGGTYLVDSWELASHDQRYVLTVRADNGDA